MQAPPKTGKQSWGLCSSEECDQVKRGGCPLTSEQGAWWSLQVLTRCGHSLLQSALDAVEGCPSLKEHITRWGENTCRQPAAPQEGWGRQGKVTGYLRPSAGQGMLPLRAGTSQNCGHEHILSLRALPFWIQSFQKHIQHIQGRRGGPPCPQEAQAQEQPNQRCPHSCVNLAQRPAPPQ